MERVNLTKVKYIHRRDTLKNPLNINFGIKNESQDCKIGTVEGWMVNEGDEGEGIWLVYFIYIHEMNGKSTCSFFKWGKEGVGGRWCGNIINVQCKTIGNREISAMSLPI
jgi:hypothetical protein